MQTFYPLSQNINKRNFMTINKNIHLKYNNRSFEPDIWVDQLETLSSIYRYSSKEKILFSWLKLAMPQFGEILHNMVIKSHLRTLQVNSLSGNEVKCGSEFMNVNMGPSVDVEWCWTKKHRRIYGVLWRLWESELPWLIESTKERI